MYLAAFSAYVKKTLRHDGAKSYLDREEGLCWETVRDRRS